MAHAHAADALDADLAAALARALAQGVKQLIASLGHAAGTEADVDLGEAIAGPVLHFLGGFRPAAALLPGQIFADLARRFLRGGIAHRRVAHLHHRRERATAQAGDRFDGELPRRVRVRARRNAQAAVATRPPPSPAPATWQAVPWQTRRMCLPAGLRRNMS